MKEQLIQWLTNLDYGKFFAIIMSWLGVYGGLLLGLIIGIIKTRITKNKIDEKMNLLEAHLTEKQIELVQGVEDRVIEKLSAVETQLITQNVKAQEDRYKLIAGLKEDANEAIEEIKQITVDDVLNKLGE